MTNDRKFKLAVCCILTFVVLLLLGKVTSTDFISLITITFGSFVVGNVADKFAPKDKQ